MAKRGRKKTGFAGLGKMADDALLGLREKIDDLLRGRLEAAETGIARMRAMIGGTSDGHETSNGRKAKGRKGGAGGAAVEKAEGIIIKAARSPGRANILELQKAHPSISPAAFKKAVGRLKRQGKVKVVKGQKRAARYGPA